MIRHTLFGICMTLCAATSSHVLAADLFWLGGTGDLQSANYADSGQVNTGLSPTEGDPPFDVLFIGNSGTANFTGATASYGRIRIGHNNATLSGPGTLNVSGGANLTFLNTATGLDNAGVIVGRVNNGTLNIDGSTVQSNRSVVVGFGTNSTRVGTLNISNGGILNILAADLTLGDRTNSPTGPQASGMQGVVTMNGEGSQVNVANLFNIGARSATATYTQNDGLSSIGGNTTVGNRNADNSSLTVLGGTFETGGSVTVGAGVAATNENEFVSGASITFGGDALVTLGGNLTVAIDDSQNSSATISGTAHVTTPHNDPPDSAGSVFFGRGRSQNTTFTMTGGTFDVGTRFLMGTAETTVGSPGATNIVGNQSGGVINTVLDFTLADTNGDSTYNLSGTGEINVGAYLFVGRQRKLGVMNQTEGDISVAQGVRVGDADNINTAIFGTGVYNISGGTLTANTITTNALSIAPAGTGTFRVIGDDAIIDVNGDMVVNAGGSSQGTLAYQLETGDLLSQINVTGAATFNAGSILAFDFSNAAPTQTTYDVLTATTISDLGIAFSGSGWGYQIVPGGNGQILQLIQSAAPGLPGDHNEDGVVDAADYVVWRKLDIDGAQGYIDFLENFGESALGGGGAVPEPATLLLCCIATCGLAAIRRR